MGRRPVQKRATERRRSLLLATARLLEREGFEAVNTNAIAREAGASVGTVYDYFPNKEAVLSALLEHYRQGLFAATMGALSNAAELSLDALVERAVLAFADYYRREPGYAELWLGSQLLAPLRDAGEAWGRDFSSALAALVQARTGADEPRAQRVALTVVHAVSSVVTLALTRPAAEQAPLIAEAVRLAQAYLRDVRDEPAD